MSNKFMLSVDNRIMLEILKPEADARGITVQELIRAVMIPDWIRRNPDVVTKRLLTGMPESA
jgi:hypothetical protein